jgi:tripartite-type tricarboxylate transporter receptor subunit TctC
MMASDARANRNGLSRRHVIVRGSAAITGVLLGTAGSDAQQPVRLVVGFAPGGGVDTSARLVAQALQPSLAQTVIVENRPGAGSTLGVKAVVDAPPDGAVALYASSSGISVAPAIYKSLPYDARKDLTPVSPISLNSSVMVVRKDLPARTLQEYIAYAKANLGKLTFGSSGVGGGPHLQGSRLMALLGATANHIPYRGGANALTDLVAGRFDFMIDFLGLCLPQIRAGNVRGLAVIARRRLVVLPDVPTFQEAGLPAMQGSSWDGIFLPPHTPQPIVARWAAAIARAKAEPNVVQKIQENGSELVTMSPEEFKAFVASEIERWQDIATTAKIDKI